MPETRADAICSYALALITILASLGLIPFPIPRDFYTFLVVSTGVALIGVTWSAQRAQGRRW